MDQSESVAETNVESQTSSEDVSAQEQDLDSLLNEFDEGTQVVEPKNSNSGEQQNIVSREEFQRLQETIADQQYKTDIQSVVQEVKGEVNIPFVDDVFVETWISSEAAKNPKLATAWMNRHQNPDTFKKVVNSLSKTFQEKFNVDAKITSDMDSVSAAVRSASTKSPEPETEVDWSNLNDNEFYQKKMELLRGSKK